MPDHGDLLDVPAAVESLGVTQRWVRRAVAERRISFVKVGRHVRFEPQTISRYTSSETAKQPATKPRESPNIGSVEDKMVSTLSASRDCVGSRAAAGHAADHGVSLGAVPYGHDRSLRQRCCGGHRLGWRDEETPA